MTSRQVGQQALIIKVQIIKPTPSNNHLYTLRLSDFPANVRLSSNSRLPHCQSVYNFTYLQISKAVDCNLNCNFRKQPHSSLSIPASLPTGF